MSPSREGRTFKPVERGISNSGLKYVTSFPGGCKNDTIGKREGHSSWIAVFDLFDEST
jgi:hypothetical protein